MDFIMSLVATATSVTSINADSQSSSIIKDIATFFDSDLMKIFTGIAAIFAFVISISNFISSIWAKRKRISIMFDGMYISDYKIEVGSGMKVIAKIRYSVSNLSQLPISITRIRLIVRGQYIESEPRPYIAEEFIDSRAGVSYNHDIIKTTVLPIRLDSLGAHFGYLAFLIPPDMLSGHETALNFEICTNRGKAIQKSFSLHEENLLF